MARGKPVVLDTISFRTKKDAITHFRTILAKYSPGETVSGADGAHLIVLLNRHPEAADKIGVGIHHFEVISAEFATKWFAVVQRNGTLIDFSYLVCVNNDPN